MVKLTIGNSTSKIDGLDLKQFNAIRDTMSYSLPKQQQFYAGWSGSGKKHLMDKRGEFPTGLLYCATNYLLAEEIIHEVVDLRIAPIRRLQPFKLTLGHDPYPEQQSAARAAKALKRGIITMPTGSGKSLVAALIINELQVNTLVVVPSLELKRQLTESLSKAFGSKVVGKGLPIWVENVDALGTREPIKGYDCVVIDEFHHSGAKTYRALNKHAWAGIYYRIGLTATPFRSMDEERLFLESVLSQVIYKLEYETAVRKGYIVPMEAYYAEIPTTKTDAFTWPEVYKELIVENEARNDMIRDLMSSLLLAEKSTLCLVKEIKHGERLKPFPFTNGQDEESKDFIAAFNERRLKVLTGTTGIIGEGVDTKPCEYVIIAGLGKSKNAFMQQCGRGFRVYPGKESCKIIIFLDKSHKFTKAHFAAQKKILETEYNVRLVKLSLD